MPIRLLDEKTIARIAAGEVIERPASVVKELVENAIDAGARQITVETRDGGIGMIRVSDDGSGIPAEEVGAAFQRHATSKLRSIEDLDTLDTLGFRGEALASVAAVAEVEVVTATNRPQGGRAIRLRHGKVEENKGMARDRGTTVTVRQLFRNVPARFKFMKSTATENSHVAGIVTQYALAYPEVAFTLLTDDRQVLQSTGSGKLLDVLIDVYGTQVAGQMLDVQSEALYTSTSLGTSQGKPSEINVTGMVSRPSVAKGNRDALSFFVNRRAVVSRALSYAVEEAYHGRLMQGRHPVAVLNITLPARLVDVNVHPTKAEVKFADERAVFGAVQKAVRAALAESASIPSVAQSTATYTGTRPPTATQSTDWTALFPARTDQTSEKGGVFGITKPSKLPLLRIVGQVAASYIVAEGPDGVYVVDQHAAHERIRYEQLQRERSTSKVSVQGLLQPTALEVTPRQDAVLQENLTALAVFGFDIAPFGERSYLVRTVPKVLAETDFLSAVREFLDEPAKRDKERSEAILKTLACHSAVRAGQALSDPEMQSLIRQLEQCADPLHCPHGRPTLIQLTYRQMEREFGRV